MKQKYNSVSFKELDPSKFRKVRVGEIITKQYIFRKDNEYYVYEGAPINEEELFKRLMLQGNSTKALGCPDGCVAGSVMCLCKLESPQLPPLTPLPDEAGSDLLLTPVEEVSDNEVVDNQKYIILHNKGKRYKLKATKQNVLTFKKIKETRNALKANNSCPCSADCISCTPDFNDHTCIDFDFEFPGGVWKPSKNTGKYIKKEIKKKHQ